MGFYKSTDQAGQPLNTAYAEDVGQLVDVLTGQRDSGSLSLLGPVANPSQAPTVTLSAGGITGTGYQWAFYWITGILDGTGAAHVTGRTLAGPLSAAQALTAQEATVSISGITAPTGVIGWGVVRNKSGGGTWYEVPGSEQFLTLAGTMPSSFIDNVVDGSLVTVTPAANTTGSAEITFGDANLYRSAAGTLKTDGSLIVGGSLQALLGFDVPGDTANNAYESFQTAAHVAFANFLLPTDSQPAYKVGGDGKEQWGPGGATTPDTNLYRSAAAVLKTDGSVRVGSWLGVDDGGTGAKLYFGSAQDTNLYRSAASTLKTDSALIIGGNSQLIGSVNIGASTARATPLWIHIGTNENFYVRDDGGSAEIGAADDTFSAFKVLLLAGSAGGVKANGLSVHRHPYSNDRHIESGGVSVTTSGANGSGSAAVSFTSAFSATPTVVASTQGVTPMSAGHTDSASTSGFTAYAANFNGTGPSTLTVNWHAEGN